MYNFQIIVHHLEFMVRILACLCLYLLSFPLLASTEEKLYQVDLIVFTHLQAPVSPSSQAIQTSPPEYSHAIPLVIERSGAKTPYHLLARTASHLSNEYWALNRKPQYQVLFHYTWLEPQHHHAPVALLPREIGGWRVEGVLKINKDRFYSLTANLFFSAPGSEQAPFKVTQEHRLNPGVVYYLDHPKAGMIIQINPVI